MAVRPYLVNGEWRTGDGSFEVHSPYDDSVVAEIGVPTDADVEEATATAHETFAESSKLPVHARADALDHISKRLGETIEENAKLIAAGGRQAAQVGDGRSDTRRLHVPLGLRGDPPRGRRADPSGHRGRARLARGTDPSVPDRPRPRDHPVQFPAEPRRAQGGAVARRGSADRREAGERDPNRLAPSGGVLRRDRSPEGDVPGAAGVLEGGRRDGSRRSLPEDLLHGVCRDRLVPEGPRSEEAGDARAGRERRRDRRTRTPTSTSPPSGSRSAATTRRARAASASSACWSPPRFTTTSRHGS